MTKKIIFVDLDGTLINNGNRDVLQSTKDAINQAKTNGHLVVLSTGRPPMLFYGLDKQLGIDSYIACNGRYVVVDGEVIYKDSIPTNTISELVEYCKKERIDISMQNDSEFVLQSDYEDFYKKFSDNFNMEYPILKPDYYKELEVYQMGLYYHKDDFEKFNELFPTLSFHFSCKYGLDVNAKGGMKELGVKKVVEHLKHKLDDTIAIGDGFNDIGMIQLAGIGVAMGNAPKEVKDSADIIARKVNEDAINHLFIALDII